MKALEVNSAVIVIDNSNYKAEYSEEVPFKAVIMKNISTYSTPYYIVKSESTGKEYELYYYQILEALDLEEIKDKLK